MAEAVRTIDDQWADPRWRLNNLYTITDKRGRSVPFRLNTAQEQLFDDMHFLNVILKSRQRGATTFFCLYMLDACVFNSNTRAGVVAHNLEDAVEFFSNKVKYPYDMLDEQIREANPASQDSARSLKFKNNSGLRVATSLRSGTYQYLLVSEYGKICARYPDKAREIRTGALNTVQSGEHIFIESTAEGRSGDFYRICQEAQNAQHKRLTPLDFRFHFLPWWDDPDCDLTEEEAEGVTYQAEAARVFEALADKGIELTDTRKAWYAKKLVVQDEDMKQEYPGTPEEAFEAALAGAYFSKQMALARKQQRIASVPVDPKLPVNTFWDLGINDNMCIWLHQQHGKEHRFVGYYENSGEGFGHYASWLRMWADERDAVFGKHVGPHDIEVRNLDEHATTRKEAAQTVGIKFEVAPRVAEKADGIQLMRTVLGLCWFDEGTCSDGIMHLDEYRKEWNDQLGIWRNQPRHDAASHGADAFQTFAIAEDRGMIGPKVRSKLDYASKHKGLA